MRALAESNQEQCEAVARRRRERRERERHPPEGDGVEAVGGMDVDAPDQGEGEIAPMEEDAETMPDNVLDPVEEDVWRDMSGDAITTSVARERGVHAQCSLAAVRNLRRNQDYTRQRLAERCVTKSYTDDVRFPDWAALMLPMLGATEVVKRGKIAEGPADHATLYDLRAAVVIVSFRATNHVVCIHNDRIGGFRLYDNDSAARAAGTYEAITTATLVERFSGSCFIGIMDEDSDLSQGLREGPLLTILTRRQRTREQVVDEGEVAGDARRPRMTQLTLRGLLRPGDTG